MASANELWDRSLNVQLLLVGLSAGVGLAAIYVLISLAFTIVLTAAGVFNFAQASIVMGATFEAFYLGSVAGFPGIVVLGLSLAAGAVAGWISYAICVRPALGRSRDVTEATLLTTFGLGIAVNSYAALQFGAEPRAVASYVSRVPILIGGVPVQPIYLVMIGVAAAVVIATEIILRKTEIGHVFRFTLEDPEGAQLVGIKTKAVIQVTFIIAGAISGGAGYLVAPVISASAYSAQNLAFYGFAAIAIGGFGSFTGTLIGGLIVGLLGGVVPAVLNSAYINPILWGIILTILLVKPAGLWGTAGLFGSAKSRDV